MRIEKTNMTNWMFRGLVFMCLWCCLLPAQAQKVYVSEGISMVDVLFYEPLGKIKDHYYLFVDRGDEWSLLAYDAQMRPYQTRTLFSPKQNDASILSVFERHEFVYICYTFKQRGENVLRLHRYSTEGLLVDSAEVLRVGDRINVPVFEPVLAPNKQFLVLHIDNLGQQIDMIRINVDSLKMTWRNFMPLKRPLDNEDFVSVLPDNVGGVYLVMDRDNFHAVREKHRFSAIYFNNTGTESTVEMDPEGALTNACQAAIDTTRNELWLGALYSRQHHVASHGYWTCRWNGSSTGLLKPVQHPFTTKFCKAISDQVTADSSVANLDLLQPVFRKDGGVLLMLERSRDINRVNAGTPRLAYRDINSSFKDYYREQLGILSVGPNGEVEWQGHLFKKQFSYDDGAINSSVGLVFTPKKMRLLYNDEIKSEGTVSEYVIGSGGQSSRRTLFSTQGQDILVAFKYLQQTGPNEAVAPSIMRNKLRMVRIVL